MYVCIYVYAHGAGERIGGEEYLQNTRKTIGEVKAERKELLKHWVELQRQTYRKPWGGAMENVTDTSILRHDTSVLFVI
jgi:hypothetical protein